jgi:hypothetical protein
MYKTCHICFVEYKYLLPILEQKQDKFGNSLDEWLEKYICFVCLKNELLNV